MKCRLVAACPVSDERNIEYPALGHGVEKGVCLKSLGGPYALRERRGGERERGKGGEEEMFGMVRERRRKREGGRGIRNGEGEGRGKIKMLRDEI